jgi:hypothetical protein
MAPITSKCDAGHLQGASACACAWDVTSGVSPDRSTAVDASVARATMNKPCWHRASYKSVSFVQPRVQGEPATLEH